MDERNEVERDLRFGAAIGREILRDPDASVWNDERFLDWYGNEARERDRRLRRMSDDELLAEGRQLVLRAQARRLRMRRLGGRVTPRTPPIVGRPGDVLERANATGAMPVVDLAVAAGVGRELWDEEVDTWAELPHGAPPGRYLALRIAGDSMVPLMHTGDMVMVSVDSRIARGTVVVVRHPEDGYLCKIVRRIGPRSIELGSADPSRSLIQVPNDARLVVGTVKLVWCHHTPAGTAG